MWSFSRKSFCCCTIAAIVRDLNATLCVSQNRSSIFCTFRKVECSSAALNSAAHLRLTPESVGNFSAEVARHWRKFRSPLQTNVRSRVDSHRHEPIGCRLVLYSVKEFVSVQQVRLIPASLKQASFKVYRAKTLHAAGKDANAPRFTHQSVLLLSNILMILNTSVRVFQKQFP